MAAPVVIDFGDEAHDSGETGLTIDGFQFGFFSGAAWMFQNANRTGASDQLTVGTWTDMQLTGVAIPGSPTNATGTVFLFVRTENLEWSLPYEFTMTIVGGGQRRLRMAAIIHHRRHGRRCGGSRRR